MNRPPNTGATPTSGASSNNSTQAAAADREQKMLEAATENMLSRLADVRASITSLIAKLENDPFLNWPSFLDSYALVSGQLNTMVRNIKSERTPSFKRYICLPLTLSQERDEELARSTEGRCGQFSHDLVPDYLRTKPDPEVEARHALYESRVATLNPEQMHKQLGVMEKMTKEMLKHITKEREDIESRATARAEFEKTFAFEDTFSLVAAVSHGKGIRMVVPPGQLPGQMMRPGGPPGPPGGPQGPTSQPPGGKMAPGLKTNIRAANQVHPYSR